MIRTETVQLTVIPAVAFRQKLPTGGAGVSILRYDVEQPGVASISKTSGKAIPAANTPAELYPEAAFAEAIAMTAGMPYTRRGSVKLDRQAVVACPPEDAEEPAAEEILVDSADYQKIVDAYTDKSGKLSCELLNKDLIRFSHASRTVKGMIAEGDSQKKVRAYILHSKFQTVTGNKRLTEDQAVKMGELLDEVSPKSVFKALNAELRKQSAAQKRR